MVISICYYMFFFSQEKQQKQENSLTLHCFFHPYQVSFYLPHHHSFLMCEGVFNHCSSSKPSRQAFALHHLHGSTSSPLLWFVTVLTGTNHMKSDFLPRSDHAVAAHTVSLFYGSFSHEKTLIAVSRRPVAGFFFFLPLFECNLTGRVPSFYWAVEVKLQGVIR